MGEAFTVAWKIGRNRRDRKTFMDPEAADRFANTKLNELAKGGAGLLIEVPLHEWQEYQHQLSQLNGVPIQAAISFYLERKKIIPHRCRAIGAVTEELLRSPAVTAKGDDYRDSLAGRLHFFVRAVGDETPIDGISPAHLTHFACAKHWRRKKIQPYIESIGLLFVFAKTRGYLPSLVPTAIERSLVFESATATAA